MTTVDFKTYIDGLTDDEKYNVLLQKAIKDFDNDTDFIGRFFKENPDVAKWVFQRRVVEMIEEGL